MKIISSLKEMVDGLKAKIRLGWIWTAISGFCSAFFGYLFLTSPYSSIWTPSLFIITGILVAILNISNIKQLRNTKNCLALWQDIEDGKYKNRPLIQQMCKELEKAEEERNRHRWNMDVCENQMEKLQGRIEAALLNK